MVVVHLESSVIGTVGCLASMFKLDIQSVILEALSLGWWNSEDMPCHFSNLYLKMYYIYICSYVRLEKSFPVKYFS